MAVKTALLPRFKEGDIILDLQEDIAVEVAGAASGFDAFDEARLKLSTAALKTAEKTLEESKKIEVAPTASQAEQLRGLVEGLAERKRRVEDATAFQFQEPKSQILSETRREPPMEAIPGLPQPDGTTENRGLFSGLGGLFRWPGRGSGDAPVSARQGLPVLPNPAEGPGSRASASAAQLPPAALRLSPGATPEATIGPHTSVDTNLLPSTPAQRGRSRRSMTSKMSAAETEVDHADLDMQFSVEVSYGESQRPMPMTEERHKMGLKRQFHEMDVGETERAQALTELGIGEEGLDMLRVL